MFNMFAIGFSSYGIIHALIESDWSWLIINTIVLVLNIPIFKMYADLKELENKKGTR